MSVLSNQENRVAGYIALGYTEKEVANMLFISEHTVHTHTRNIRKKTGSRNMVDIARYFILSLDNPKDVSKWVVCFVVQLFMVFSMQNFDVRKVGKSRPVRVVRVVKKGKSEKII